MPHKLRIYPAYMEHLRLGDAEVLNMSMKGLGYVLELLGIRGLWNGVVLLVPQFWGFLDDLCCLG